MPQGARVFKHARVGVLMVALATALTTFSAGQASAAQIRGWQVVGQTSVLTAAAGEGVATVRVPGQAARTYFTAGPAIPAPIQAEGWGHIGDPDSRNGFIFDPYQQIVPAPTMKMFMVTTPTGQQFEYTHQMADDELAVNAAAYDAITPNGQWMVSSELAPITRLLVFPTPLVNPSTPQTGGTIQVATRLICASDDSNNDIYPTSKPLLQIDLKHQLNGKDVTARVTSLGQIPLASTCVGAYTVEGVDYDTPTGQLRVEVVPPSPCNTNITVYTLQHA
jgi:hypothetical protein